MPVSYAVATDRKMNLLIASEREILARTLADSVRAQGHQALVQENAAGVADALGVPGLDAVVLDADLPGVDWEQLRSALIPSRPVVPEPLDAVERRHIATTLRYTNGNRRNAAQLLGIARSTLLAKLRKYSLDND
ncbi:MAG: hypothetical protein EXR94_06330 [Gemmatimonadetes bacterium]|nr:hypothetical protein [Gemmatimonadota bacterium]